MLGKGYYNPLWSNYIRWVAYRNHTLGNELSSILLLFLALNLMVLHCNKANVFADTFEIVIELTRRDLITQNSLQLIS